MPINCAWGNSEQTILYVQFDEIWTVDEFYAAIDEMYRFISSVRHTVHIISDFSRSRTAPNRLLSMGPYIEDHKAINAGISVLIGLTGFLKSLLQVAQRTYLADTRIYLANSTEEAYQIIRRHQLSTER